MVAGARTFSFEETFVPAQVLNPPPTRHALFAFLLALAAVLHIGTAGWGDLYDGNETRVAAAAREMVESGQWLARTNDGIPVGNTSLVTCWALATSYKIFGVNVTAARLPIAFAMIGLVALTFLIGERLAGYWRGFGAGLILLCSGGAFALGRIVGPDAIFAFFFCAAIYSMVRGYQGQKFRRAWFVGFWLCASLATLTIGLAAVLYLVAVAGLLMLFLREARLRFRVLFHWTNLLLFLAIVVPWFIWVDRELPWFVGGIGARTFPRWHLLLLHLAWWFPAIFLISPGFIFRPRKNLRADEVTLAERLPICWLLVSVVVELLLAEEPCAAIATAPAFALLAAAAWQRTSRPLRALGIMSALIVGLGMAATGYFRPEITGLFLGSALNDVELLSLRPLILVAAASILVSALAALILLRQRGEITLVLALATMVPVGWCLIESRTRVAPVFSLAEAARYLNPRLGRSGEVVYEGSIESGNSLAFYLEKKFFLVNQSPRFQETDAASQNKYLDEHFLLEAWDRSNPIYLITAEDRVPYWRQLITDRVHIYHQVGTCGSRVVLSNQM